MEIGIGDRQVRIERQVACGIERACDQEVQPDRRIRIGSWLRILSLRNRYPEQRYCAERPTKREQACGRCLNSSAVSIAHHGRAHRRRDLTVHADAPDMTTRTGFSKEQERSGAAEIRSVWQVALKRLVSPALTLVSTGEWLSFAGIFC